MRTCESSAVARRFEKVVAVVWEALVRVSNKTRIRGLRGCKPSAAAGGAAGTGAVVMRAGHVAQGLHT